jgi:nifR3 family TIM-barrel protein
VYVRPIQIGNVKINNNIFLAPMAGITDMPFRIICKEFGAGLVYTEMISSKGMFYNDENTKELMNIDSRERPVAVQIFGSDPKIMGDIAEEVSKEADIIDINMGCPAPKIIKNGEGAKLMLRPDLIDEITKQVVSRATVPVTIKIRKGWDNENINAIEIAKIAEKNGVSAITVHGRTRAEFYSGTCDLDIIRKVKENVNIPVVGSGDVVDGESAKRMFDVTNCDAIMIGRGSNGNPWIFREVFNFLENEKEISKPTSKEKLDIILKHLNMSIGYKGEYTAIREMRKHISWYLKGIPKASEIKNKINRIENINELKETLNKCLAL